MDKILIFSITYFPYVGGAEVAVKEITDRITDKQFDMITLRFSDRLPKYERIGNVNIYRIGFTQKDPTMTDLVRFPLMLNKYLFPFIAYLKARKLHKENRYGAIWSIMANYAGFASLFFKFFNRKVSYLLTLQEGDSFEHIKNRVGFLYGLYEKIFINADHIQTISNYLADYARAMGYQGKVDVIPNGVDTRHFSKVYPESEIEELKNELGKQPGDIFLITTSRLVPKNAVNDVIVALGLLPANIKFLILGTGPDSEKLKALTIKNNLDQRARFLGQIDHDKMPKYLNASDIFVRPSLSEGLGNSFLEAMAAGLPVIATSVGGIPDFLFDPEKNPEKEPTGLFCEPGNPESIAEKIKLLLVNKELKEKIKLNAKVLIRAKYDWAGICKEMEKIFNTIKPD